ncbi:radical SAM/SPASM domain-containing protein [Sphingomonas sp.]|uniref:radical SAM/SPASM domain-containing protein n=1 Tax=Sphingomonas sp. TaxID=28214 RepID=UPI003B3B5513
MSGSLLLQVFRIRGSLAPATRLGWIGRLRGETASYLHTMRKVLRRPIASSHLKAAQILNNDWVDIFLPRGAVDAGDHLALRITAADVTWHQAGTVWTSSIADRVPGHVASYFDGYDLGDFGVSAKLHFAPTVPAQALPHMLLYSPVTQCNLNCIHCISRDTRKSVNRLSPAIKGDIQGWARDGRLLSMNSDYSGDLLWADHRFGGELDFVIGLGIPFQIDTNGAYLTQYAAERLCRSRVTHVNISLDAATDETFRHVRIGAPPLDQVLANVRELLNLRATSGAQFRVMLGITLMASNIDEWLDFIRMTAAIGADGINAAHLHAYTAEMEPQSLWHQPELFNRLRTEAINLAAFLGLMMGVPPPFHGVAERGHRHCAAPWQSAVILGNGDVAACCVPGTVMGNLYEQSMEEIWRGPHYRRLRETINSDAPPSPCSICPMFRRPGNKGSYLQYSARVAADEPEVSQWH